MRISFCLPRIRGGVSRVLVSRPGAPESSPHTRGCFHGKAYETHRGQVFPAYAGVFPTDSVDYVTVAGLPRIRGGVSGGLIPSTPAIMSSPHTRGCFSRPWLLREKLVVFPAYAGVFPSSRSPSSAGGSLPRIRGGVSVAHSHYLSAVTSSPHTRGCFPSRSPSRRSGVVFPAYAGVFPTLLSPCRSFLSLPRIRGGVSNTGGSD